MRVLMLLALGSAAIFAQANDWTLLRAINPGQTVHVHLSGGHTQGGRYVSASDTSIVVHRRSGDQTFPKGQIEKISVRKGVKRWRNVAIGAGVGAAIGVGLAAPSINSKGNNGFLPCFCGARFAVALGAAFGIIGGGAGALFPGYDTIYRIPRKK